MPNFFSLLKKFIPSNSDDDELSVETEGILNSNSINLDETSGNLIARPNIPKISLLPTTSQKFKRTNDYLSGNRRKIIGLSDPSNSDPDQPMSPVEKPVLDPSEALLDTVLNGNRQTTSNDPEGLVDTKGTSDMSPANERGMNELVPLLNSGQSDFRSDAVRALNPSGQATTEDFRSDERRNVNQPDEKNWSNYNPAESILNNLMNGQTLPDSTVKKPTDALEDVAIPDAPIDQPLQTSAKDSPKWKDILVGILDNISRTDLNKIPPEQRTAAFLGAIAGGTAQGAGTGRYAGKRQMEVTNAQTSAKNKEAQEIYEGKLKNVNSRITAQNNKLAPVFKQQAADLAQFKADLNQKVAEGKLTQAQAELELKKEKSNSDFRVKMLNLAQKDEQFKVKLKQFKTFKTTANADGSFGLIGVRGDGTSEPVKDSSGALVNMPDPSAWARTLQDIQASQLDEVSRVPVTRPEDRRAYIDGKVQADLQANYPDLDKTSRKGQKILKELEDKYADDYDKTNPERVEQKKNAAKAQGAKRVLNAPRAKSRPTIQGAVNGIDFSTQFKQSQKGQKK